MKNPDRFKKMTNEQLLLSVRLGNSIAFDAIFDRYWKQLYIRGHRILNDLTVLETIIQDVFSEFWKNIKKTYIADLEFHLLDEFLTKITELYKTRKDLFKEPKRRNNLPKPPESSEG